MSRQLSTGVIGRRKKAKDFPVDGLVSYYAFEEESGITVIDSVGNNDGTVDELHRSENGKIGKCVGDANDFGGGVLITGVSTSNNTMSYNCWTDIRITNNFRYIFDDEQSRNIIRVFSNYLLWDGVGWLDTGVSTLDAFENFVMITLVCDGLNTFFYHNSILKATFSIVNGNIGGITRIGNHHSLLSTNTRYGGFIDEFGIWDRALTQEEITQLYNNGNGITL